MMVNTNSSLSDVHTAIKRENPDKIHVTVRVPDNLHERVRQQKINRIYDILSPDRFLTAASNTPDAPSIA